MKVGILGGSFNPPHKGHIFIAKCALKKFNLSQIWIAPTLLNPLKQNPEKNFEERLDLCKNFFKNHPKIKVKNYKNHSVSTYELIKKIRAENPQIKFYFIVGEDSLKNFHKWKNYKKLTKLIKFLVFLRKEKNFDLRKTKVFNICQKNNNKNLPKFEIIKNKNIDISSTKIRKENDNR